MLPSNDPLDRAARGRVHLARDSTGQEGQASGAHGEIHRFRHRHRILRAGNRRVHQHGVGAQFHRQRGIRRGSHARIDNDGDAGKLPDDANVVHVLDPEPRPDGRTERHHGRRAGGFELPAHDGIVARVGQHDETFAHENAGRLEERFVVGIERFLVADHFELHPVRQASFAPEPRGPYGILGRVTAGSVRQDEDPGRIDVIEQRLLRAVRDVDPSHGDGDDIGARGLVRVRHDGIRRVLAGADDETGGERSAGDCKGIHGSCPHARVDGPRNLPRRMLRTRRLNPEGRQGFPPVLRVLRRGNFHSLDELLVYPPPTKLTTSICSPSLTSVLSNAARFRTARLCSTATDRTSTRLNSSHITISYAVFCLKKKKTYRLSPSRYKIKEHIFPPYANLSPTSVSNYSSPTNISSNISP